MNLNDEQIREANKPIPTGIEAFITVNLLTSTPIGITENKFLGDTETEQLQDSYISMISINAYGPNAYGQMLRLYTLMRSSYVSSELKKLKAGLLLLSPVRNLPTPEGAGYEERAQFDMSLTHAHVTNTPLYRIDKADTQLYKEY